MLLSINYITSSVQRTVETHFRCNHQSAAQQASERLNNAINEAIAGFKIIGQS